VLHRRLRVPALALPSGESAVLRPTIACTVDAGHTPGGRGGGGTEWVVVEACCTLRARGACKAVGADARAGGVAAPLTTARRRGSARDAAAVAREAVAAHAPAQLCVERAVRTAVRGLRGGVWKGRLAEVTRGAWRALALGGDAVALAVVEACARIARGIAVAPLTRTLHQVGDGVEDTPAARRGAGARRARHGHAHAANPERRITGVARARGAHGVGGGGTDTAAPAQLRLGRCGVREKRRGARAGAEAIALGASPPLAARAAAALQPPRAHLCRVRFGVRGLRA